MILILIQCLAPECKAKKIQEEIVSFGCNPRWHPNPTKSTNKKLKELFLHCLVSIIPNLIYFLYTRAGCTSIASILTRDTSMLVGLGSECWTVLFMEDLKSWLLISRANLILTNGLSFTLWSQPFDYQRLWVTLQDCMVRQAGGREQVILSKTRVKMSPTRFSSFKRPEKDKEAREWQRQQQMTRKRRRWEWKSRMRWWQDCCPWQL